MCYDCIVLERVIEVEENEILGKAKQEETNKLMITDMLKETTKMAGDMKITSLILAGKNDELSKLFENCSNQLDEFNKQLASYRAKC